ncbi:12205_t:CDS:2 [Funneliformis caledonium]|uniref:12205_t:CDS:1 n=1 Tax=Funneliformis caledonium TaxID=1117310 RepID=A0A9N9HJD9_9GLOM|nr:12205_t:CDS:2 [Funneliformis caledonium]
MFEDWSESFYDSDDFDADQVQRLEEYGCHPQAFYTSKLLYFPELINSRPQAKSKNALHAVKTTFANQLEHSLMEITLIAFEAYYGPAPIPNVHRLAFKLGKLTISQKQ